MAEPTARVFQLVRHTDVTGVSGTGVVADGVLWPDGTVSIRWRGERPSVVFWERLADAEAVHGHGGATRFVWLVDGERNRLARELADAIDEYEGAAAAAETARGELAEKCAEYDTAGMWLDLIAERGCDTTHAAKAGTCINDPDRYAVARWTAAQWCDPCRAWAAQNGVPMSTQPVEASDG